MHREWSTGERATGEVVRRAGARAAAGLLALAMSVSCGSLTREGTAASYLVIERLAGPNSQGGDVVRSDVVTDGTRFEDLGTVSFRLALRDPGPPSAPTSPSPNNWITVSRFRVVYIRADGRNTPGVDVPHPFDGAMTTTVQGNVTATFTLVRVQAKFEAPLAALATNLNVISTIAQVTFYGHDQTGREVSATGQVSVNFANWADN